jgi:hypothetical protein
MKACWIVVWKYAGKSFRRPKRKRYRKGLMEE